MTDDDPSPARPEADPDDAEVAQAGEDADPPHGISDGEADDDESGSGPPKNEGWDPGDVAVEEPFDDLSDETFDDDAGNDDGDDATVVSDPADFLREDHWFEDERDITPTRGTVFLLAMAGAGLYASSFVFAAVGLQFIAPPAAETYVELLSGAMLFLSIPMVAYLAAGLGIEGYIWRTEGEIPETSLPLVLLVPVVLHVSLFFVEWVEFGYTTATLADLFAREPGLAQLLLWPPVVVGTIFAVVVYRASLSTLAGTGDAVTTRGQGS